MSLKKTKRLKRARKIRSKIAGQNAVRLTVHRTPMHFYAQIIDAAADKVLVSSSTLSADIKGKISYSGNCDAASAVGADLASKATADGIDKVAFDRSGFRYHGRVKAFADAARENGLKF